MMRITMMGFSRAGKTCYLYAMAARMSKGQYGFRFIPDNHRKSLSLNRCWNEMKPQFNPDNGTLVRQGVWPAGTGESDEIVFRFVYGTRNLTYFSWYDYRGGILDSESESDEKDYNKFVEIASESACIIVCIPAEMLQAYMHGDSMAESRLNIILDDLTKYRESRNDYVPVTFAILKADCLAPGEFSRGVKAIREGVFAPLFSQDENWLLMFVGVSLGKFDRNQGDIDPKTHRRFINGTLEPVNVELPVFFAFYCKLKDAVRSKNEEMNKNANAQDIAKGKLQTYNSRTIFGRWWHGDEAKAAKAELEELAKDSGLIAADLQKLQVDFSHVTEALLDGGYVEIWNKGEKL